MFLLADMIKFKAFTHQTCNFSAFIFSDSVWFGFFFFLFFCSYFSHANKNIWPQVCWNVPVGLQQFSASASLTGGYFFLIRRAESSEVAQEPSTHASSGSVDLAELLSEIRHLRLQLERSIQTNTALRQRLEEQLLRGPGRSETININYLLSSPGKRKARSCMPMSFDGFRRPRRHCQVMAGQVFHLLIYFLSLLDEGGRSPGREDTVHHSFQTHREHTSIHHGKKSSSKLVLKPNHIFLWKQIQTGDIWSLLDLLCWIFSDVRYQSLSEVDGGSVSSSSGDSISGAPSRLVPGHRMWASRNGRHILGLIEDYNALRKQISDGRKLSRSMDMQLQECLHTLQQQGCDNKVGSSSWGLNRLNFTESRNVMLACPHLCRWLNSSIWRVYPAALTPCTRCWRRLADCSNWCGEYLCQLGT